MGLRNIAYPDLFQKCRYFFSGVSPSVFFRFFRMGAGGVGIVNRSSVVVFIAFVAAWYCFLLFYIYVYIVYISVLLYIYLYTSYLFRPPSARLISTAFRLPPFRLPPFHPPVFRPPSARLPPSRFTSSAVPLPPSRPPSALKQTNKQIKKME